ncbi:MAG: hypothetical protein GX794_00890 [Acholeplasmataceae bacterium]|nr:hypothetical protein [Acholeplasmataceae bacterium]
MLKRIYDEYGLDIQKIIMSEYKRLDLTLNECNVLIALFSVLEKRKTFSINAIIKRIDLDNNETANILTSLAEKGFFKMELEIKNGKEREKISLRPTFQKLEELIKGDANKIKLEKDQTKISKLINRLENLFGRVLTSYELDTIRYWFNESRYKIDDVNLIVDTLLEGNKKISVNIIEKNLKLKKDYQVEDLDQDTKDTLTKLYRSIK